MNNFVLDTNSYIDEYGNIGTFGIDVEEKFKNFTKTYDGSEISKNILNTAVAENKLEKAVDTLFSLFPYISNKYMEKFIAYTEEKLENEENNDDIYYQNVGEDVYIKNYIGFGSIEDIDKFLNFDFTVFKYIFPTRTTSIVALVFMILDVFILFIPLFAYIHYLELLKKEKYNKNKEAKKNKSETQKIEIKNISENKSERIDIKENENNENVKINNKNDEEVKTKTEIKYRVSTCKIICLIIVEILFIAMNLGISIYAITIYFKVNKNKDLDELKTIVSDEFITNFINEFISKCQKNALILSSIILLFITIATNISGVIGIIFLFKQKKLIVY